MVVSKCVLATIVSRFVAMCAYKSPARKIPKGPDPLEFRSPQC